MHINTDTCTHYPLYLDLGHVIQCHSLFTNECPYCVGFSKALIEERKVSH
jgi:hypothetical protein